jgi:hypothetical protein
MFAARLSKTAVALTGLTRVNPRIKLPPPMASGPRYIDPARTAQKTSLPLLRVLSLPGKQRVHSTVTCLHSRYLAILPRWTPCREPWHGRMPAGHIDCKTKAKLSLGRGQRSPMYTFCFQQVIA